MDIIIVQIENIGKFALVFSEKLESIFYSRIPHSAGFLDESKVIALLHIGDFETKSFTSRKIADSSKKAFSELKNAISASDFLSVARLAEKIKIDEKKLTFREHCGIELKAVFDGEKWKIKRKYVLNPAMAIIDFTKFRNCYTGAYKVKQIA